MTDQTNNSTEQLSAPIYNGMRGVTVVTITDDQPSTPPSEGTTFSQVAASATVEQPMEKRGEVTTILHLDDSGTILKTQPVVVTEQQHSSAKLDVTYVDNIKVNAKDATTINDAPKDAPKDAPAIPPITPLEFETPPHNVTINKTTVTPGSAPFPESVALPAAAMANQTKLLDSFPNFSSDKTKAGIEWGQTFLESLSTTPVDGDLDSALSREGSDWHQGIKVNNEILRSSVPKFPKPTNTEISGEQALQMAFAHMSMGDFFHAAMWNSGFWVTFKPAPEPVWLHINRLLGADVSAISRQTYGMLHSTATALTVSTIINALLPYVYATSVNISDMPITDIPRYLSNQDEHDFIWGFIAANYPQGFSIDRSCIADPRKCRAVITETLQISELQVCDHSILTEFHKNHMRLRNHGSMTMKAVQEYQDRLHTALDAVVELKSSTGGSAKLTFTVPSSDKKASMSARYVSDIQESVMKSISDDIPLNQRDNLYSESMTATEMRMYQHWVKQIEIGTNIIVDEATIGSILGSWTRDNELRRQFFDEISKFINNSAISVIGLEAAKCPVCGADHNRPEQRLRGKVDFIPIDVVQLFSHLAEFKTRLISARG